MQGLAIKIRLFVWKRGYTVSLEAGPHGNSSRNV